MAAKKSRNVTRDENPGGRPRKYASDAERQAAFRQRWAMVTARLEDRTRQTLDTIREAAGADVTISDVINAAVKFYALNFDWQSGNLFGKRLPTINDPRYRAEREKAEANKRFLEGDE